MTNIINNNNAISLTVFTGPMFAGKTTALISAWNSESGNKLAFKHAKDTRYESDNTAIITHERDSVAAIGISKCEDINVHINAWLAANGENNKITIFIDEGQFFSDIHDWYVSHVNNSAIAGIYVSGLDYDIFGKEFSQQFSKLMDIAKVVQVFNAKCYICNEPAYKTQFIDSQKLNDLTNGNVLIGGEQLFQPACNTHFTPVAK